MGTVGSTESQRLRPIRVKHRYGIRAKVKAKFIIRVKRVQIKIKGIFVTGTRRTRSKGRCTEQT